MIMLPGLGIKTTSEPVRYTVTSTLNARPLLTIEKMEYAKETMISLLNSMLCIIATTMFRRF